MKEKITIIIPTHERHHVLERAIEYYSEIDINVIIADSSIKPLTAPLPGHFRYLHFKDFFMTDKIYKALCEVETEYSCLCADDDFLSESGLNEGYKFLGNNSDYVSVHGHYVQFELINPLEKYYPLYSECIGYENSSELLDNRLKNSFNAPQIFALHKTKVLKKCLGMTKGLQAVATIEFCVPLVSLCIGKHKMLPIFWAARDIKRYTKYITHEGVNCRLDDEHIDNCSSTVDVVDWNIYLKTEEGQKFKDNFISTVKDIVPENFDPSVLFDLAFQEFFRKENKSQKNKNGISLQQIIKNLIKKLLPNLIVKKIQRINVNRARIALRHVGGYPFNDKVAMKDWISMARVIEGYRDL